ncbi:MAG TPA: O-antigen polymerase [Pyrinomonadaceae bacterium]|jgi:oligosaccharide repeat unit polymerase|nr:O-antigen polymerase [Pyrinomonadaceae bacterium]
MEVARNVSIAVRQGARPKAPAAAGPPAESQSAFLPVHLLYRAGIIAVYAVILLTIVLNVDVNRKSPAFILLCIAQVLNFAVILLPVIFYKPSFGWFHPLVFYTCQYLLFQFRSYATYLQGISHHRALPEYSVEDIVLLVAFALTLHAVSTLAYYFGFWFGPNMRTPRVSFRQPRRLSLKALAAVLFSMVVFWFYVEREGGLSGHLLSWQAGRHEALAGDYYWILLIKVSAMACLLWFSLNRRAVYQPLFWACSLVSVVINFLATGSRGTVVVFFIVAMLVWMLRERKFAPARIIGIGLLGVVLISFLGGFRSRIWKGEISLTSENEDKTVVEYFEQGAVESAERAWTNSGLLPILARVPDDVDLLYGSSYFAFFTLPVPRSVWPDKPGQVGGLVGDVFFHSPAGTPPGPIGEAYWNFHVPGVILVFFVFGTFQKWLSQSFVKYRREPAAVLVYLTVLFTVDPSTPAVVVCLMLVIPLLALLRLVGALSFTSKNA